MKKPALRINFPWCILCILFLAFGLAQAANSPIRLISSAEKSLVFTVAASDVRFTEKDVNGRLFYIPQLDNFNYTDAPGKPQLPIKGLLLGIPPAVDCKIQILELKEISLGNKNIYPQPEIKYQTDSNGLEIQYEQFCQDSGVYQQNSFYPSNWVEISADAMLRHQRVIRLQVNPVRFNPVTRQVIKADILKIKLIFISKNRPSYPRTSISNEPAFEKIYRNTLFNYKSAKKWRFKKIDKINAISAIIDGQPAATQFLRSGTPACKLYIETEGIYRLDAAYLAQLSIDWQVIDPRTIKIYNKGLELPIVVHGQEDGSFDQDDNVIFYGERNKSAESFFDPYTDINVYWLTWGGEPGKRMTVRSSLAGAAAVKQQFMRTIHLEENLAYYHGDSDLEIMSTEQVSGEGWIWRNFNGGIAAPSGESGDFRMNVINLADSEHNCQLWIRVRGTTRDPAQTDHHLEVSINNRIVGDTTFNDQSECFFNRSFSSDLLREGENIIRIKSLADMGAQIDQFYLDWIELDYRSEMKPVDNQLIFSFRPENKIAQFNLTDFDSDDIELFDLTTSSLLSNFQVRNVAFVPVEIISAGYSDGNNAQIFINGIDQISRGKRGHNLVVLNETNGLLLDAANFDTWLAQTNADSMADYISALASGRIVLAAIRDEGSVRMTEAAYVALESLGSQFTRSVAARDSWAILGRKGAAVGSVPEVHQPTGTGPAIIRDTLEIEGAANSYSIAFTDSLFQYKKYFALSSQAFKQPIGAKPDTSANLTNPSNGADYIVITHKKFAAAANRLAAYRALNNGLRTKVVLVEDIYDEFNFGLINPKAIRDFLKYTFYNWQPPAPSNVVLLGDASWDFKKSGLNSQKENYVPAYGNPVSDTWLVAFDDEHDFLPDMFVGRIPAENSEQAVIYLDKLFQYETAPSAQWKKDVLFITGGKGTTEQSGFISQSEYLNRNYVQKPPAGCAGFMIHKTTEEDLEGEKTYEIASAFNAGKLWINFVGHAGSRTWDLMFNDPDIDALTNRDKYPFITSMTCHTARFANPISSGFGEHFVLAENKGAIAFWGTSGWGYIDKDFLLLKKLFPTVLADTVHALGQAATIAKINLWELYGGGAYNVNTIHQYTLLGDPFTDIALPKKPDLTLLPQDVSISPSIPVEADSTVMIKLNIRNWGLATPESLAVDVLDIAAGQGFSYIARDFKIKPVGYSDSLTIPWKIANKAGQHTIQIVLDPQNLIKEADEANNRLELSVYIFSSSLTLSKPVDFQVVSTNTVVLQVNNPVQRLTDKVEPVYQFQLDTTESFISPLAVTSPAIPEGKVVTRWQTPELLDGAVYFWRCRKVDAPKYGKWVQRSFSVNLALNDFHWRLQEPAQFKQSIFKNSAQRASGIGLGMNQILMRVESAGAHDGNTARIFFDNNPAMDTHRGHNVALFNPFEKEVVAATFDTYKDPQQADSMVIFLNQVEQNWVVCIAIRDEGSRAMTEAAYVALEALGSRECRNVGYGDSWAFVTVKGQPEHAKETHTKMGTGFAAVNDTLQIYARQGHVITPPIGPGNGWTELSWSKIFSSSANQITVDVLGLNCQTSCWDTVRTELQQGHGESLADINRALYEQIKLQVNLSDESQLSSPLLTALDVAYLPVGDLAIGHKVVHISADTVTEGEMIRISADIYNVGLAPIDSAKIHFSCLHPDQGRIAFGEAVIVRNLGIDSVYTVTRDWNSRGYLGRNQLFIELDPDNQVRELFDFNNSYSREVFVSGDSVPPSIFVTYDGREITDGGLVAVNPRIEILIKDDSPLAISDTSFIDLFLNSERIPYFSDELVLHFYQNLNPDQADLKAKLLFTPRLTDEDYTLEIFVKDASANRWYYRKDFQVISEFKLQSVLNYPNPFEHTTYFTYILTQQADWVTIKIYTVAGRLVRILPHAANDIGYNQQHWDSLDAEGDGIANGVYLYKIIARSGDKQVEDIQKLIRMR